MVHVVWEFVVRPEHQAAFERGYGGDGPWVQLFSGFAGYRGTALLRDRENGDRYLTVDRWDSLQQRTAMLAAAHDEYKRLDQLFSGLTESEAEVGVFEQLGVGV